MRTYQSSSTMKNVSLNRAVFIFCIIALISCKKDGELLPCSAAWALDLQHEISAISAASAIYSADQSAANCTALKAAYQDYIDAMKPYGNCATLTGEDRADWQKTLNDAEADLDTLC